MEPDTDDASAAENRLIRPYMVTRGRTAASHLSVEMLVVAKRQDAGDLADEARRIFNACPKPVAIAELAARIDLPLGITRVLVADLVDSNYLKTFDTAASDDADIVRRILHALEK